MSKAGIFVDIKCDIRAVISSMMDQWNDNEGGGYFTGNEGTTPNQSNKSATRQPFLCPVTVRQVLEASEEGVKVGSRRATMVSLVGIVSDVETSSTNVKFNLSDDTGAVDCLEWIEPDEEKKYKEPTNLQENTYYHVYGCVKNAHGTNKIMVFKTIQIKDFNEVTAFMIEVLHANKYTEKETVVSVVTSTKQVSLGRNDQNPYNPIGNSGIENQLINPIQRAILDAIIAKSVGNQVGWSKRDPEMKKKYSTKQIQDALEFLVSEGHIYTTVDDEHFCST